MDVAYNRHARRSTTNLNHLSLAPLTNKFPIGDEDELPADYRIARSSSYLEGKSAPTTPGILSRSPSSARLRARQQQLAIPKSKSSSYLLKTTRPKKPANASSEWMLRAGAVLSSETRESKGQSWLVSRASSTSLVENDGPESNSFADDEFSPVSTRDSKFFSSSRGGSRATSRVNSRRGSRLGSKADLLTPLEPGSAGRRRDSDGPDKDTVFEDDFVAEPDFVDPDEEAYDEVMDEEEMKTLAGQAGSGLGGMIDRVIGWSLFPVEEDGSADGLAGDTKRQSGDQPTEQQSRRVRDESDRVKIEQLGDAARGDTVELRDDEGGWHDAAWLLNVAAKILM
ncbi:MAG: hypothetical protein M1817_004031 [Caeruleum heppii]|nr:MAG: hypothetical protein M1817_004031 [Caeruleum heppii]